MTQEISARPDAVVGTGGAVQLSFRRVPGHRPTFGAVELELSALVGDWQARAKRGMGYEAIAKCNGFELGLLVSRSMSWQTFAQLSAQLLDEVRDVLKRGTDLR